MNELTPTQIFAAILGVCAGISTIGAAVGWIIKCVKAARAPGQKIHDRLTALEQGHKQHMEYLERDNRRLEAIEEGNRVTQRALLALLKHGIDGNDEEAMRRSMLELQDYLIER